MYEFIKGIVSTKQPDHVIIDNAGIGYRLKISFTTYEKLPGVGSEVKLLTFLHVREDIFDLFGFASADEREFFYKLIAISKIGPKAALTILSGGSPEHIKGWVMAEDAKSLSGLPGIGPTTARRIIAELKPRLEKDGEVAPIAGVELDDTTMDAVQEASLALEALGYNRTDALKRLSKVAKTLGDEATTEALIKGALHRT